MHPLTMLKITFPSTRSPISNKHRISTTVSMQPHILVSCLGSMIVHTPHKPIIPVQSRLDQQQRHSLDQPPYNLFPEAHETIK